MRHVTLLQKVVYKCQAIFSAAILHYALVWAAMCCRKYNGK